MEARPTLPQKIFTVCLYVFAAIGVVSMGILLFMASKHSKLGGKEDLWILISYSAFQQKIETGEIKKVIVAKDKLRGLPEFDMKKPEKGKEGFTTPFLGDEKLPALLEKYSVPFSYE